MTSTREVLQSIAARLAEVIDQLPADPPEVPEPVTEWPEKDEHLRGEFWKDTDGDVWRWVPSESMWQVWSHEDRGWAGKTSSLAWMNYTFTRTTDPSQPRRFDSLADVAEDVDRAVGKYLTYSCELGRSSRSGTGWMMRVDAPGVRYQWAEYMGLQPVTDIEEVIDHE